MPSIIDPMPILPSWRLSVLDSPLRFQEWSPLILPRLLVAGMICMTGADILGESIKQLSDTTHEDLVETIDKMVRTSEDVSDDVQRIRELLSMSRLKQRKVSVRRRQGRSKNGFEEIFCNFLVSWMPKFVPNFPVTRMRMMIWYFHHKIRHQARQKLNSPSAKRRSCIPVLIPSRA
jgi:hypothetical protein